MRIRTDGGRCEHRCRRSAAAALSNQATEPAGGRCASRATDAAALRSRPESALKAARDMHRRTIKMIIVIVGCLLLAVELVLMRHQLASALRVLTDARPLWVLTAVGATIVSMQCFARTQRRMLNAADPSTRSNVTLARMVGLTYTANALNMTLPAGSAVSVAYIVNHLREWGSTNAAAVFTVVASGALSSGAFLALAAGSGLAAGSAGTTTVLALSAAITALIVAVAVRRSGDSDIGERWRRLLGRLLGHVERRLRRISVRSADALRDTVDGLADIHPRRRDWVAGAGLAAVNWLADFVCLVASCHAVDISVTAPVVLLTAYLAGMSAASIAFLPGGFGVIEVAMIAVLHAGGVLTTPATAAVLLYRVISCVCVVAAGWAVWSCGALARLHHA
jgi:putative heme transporter